MKDLRLASLPAVSASLLCKQELLLLLPCFVKQSLPHFCVFVADYTIVALLCGRLQRWSCMFIHPASGEIWPWKRYSSTCAIILLLISRIHCWKQHLFPPYHQAQEMAKKMISFSCASASWIESMHALYVWSAYICWPTRPACIAFMRFRNRNPRGTTSSTACQEMKVHEGRSKCRSKAVEETTDKLFFFLPERALPAMSMQVYMRNMSLVVFFLACSWPLSYIVHVFGSSYIFLYIY